MGGFGRTGGCIFRDKTEDMIFFFKIIILPFYHGNSSVRVFFGIQLPFS